jgi:hypothetical protein
MQQIRHHSFLFNSRKEFFGIMVARHSTAKKQCGSSKLEIQYLKLSFRKFDFPQLYHTLTIMDQIVLKLTSHQGEVANPQHKPNNIFILICITFRYPQATLTFLLLFIQYTIPLGNRPECNGLQCHRGIGYTLWNYSI